VGILEQHNIHEGDKVMKPIWISAAIAACVASAAAAQDAEPVQQPPNAAQRSTVTRVVRSNDGNEVQVFAFAEDSPGNGTIVVRPNLTLLGDVYGDVALADVSPHWIGLGCSAATDALRAQLGLTDGGVVVYDIVDKGPAQTAGFQKHDVLIKAVVGEKEIVLKDASDLVRAVKESNLKPFRVEGIRSGKPLALEVTPAERPQPGGAGSAFFLSVQPDGGVTIDPKRIEEFLARNDIAGLKEYVQKQPQSPATTARLHVAGPVVAPPTASRTVARHAEIPDNLSITITRTGSELAKIKVKRGSDEWGATENELETLPEDIRGHVQHMLQGVTSKTMKSWLDPRNQVRGWATTKTSPYRVPNAPVAVPALPQAGFAPPGVPATGIGAGPAGEDAFRGYQKQLEQQQKQLDAVLQQIEELKKTLEKQAPKD
jgi:hypothetical protein